MSCLQRLLVAALVVAAVSACPKTVPVRCPAVEVVQDFDVAKYLLRWYEIERSPQPFQPDGACVTAVYNLQNNPLYPVRAVNRQLNDATGEISVIIGGVRLADPDSKEGKLKVKFPDILEEADYWVLDTDYTSFALVYSCRQLTADTIYQSAWVLGRRSELDISTKRAVDAAFQKSGVDRSILVKTRHDDTCNYELPIVPEPL